MKDTDKTKEQLISELEEMRQGITKFEASEAERKQAEEVLSESEEKYLFLYSMMAEGVALHQVIYNEEGATVDYIITDVNPAFESILGIKRKDAIGSKASELYKTGSPPYLDVYARVADSGIPHSFETYFPAMNKHFKISVFSPGRDKFATVFSDITEHKQAEEALRQYEHIISSSTDMLALLDKRFNYLAVNKAYMEAFKLTPEQLVGNTVAKVFGEEFFNTVIKPNADRCLGGEEINYQDWFDFPAYGRRYMDITYYPYYGEDNKIMGFAVNRRDITERKQVEAEKRELERKVQVTDRLASIGEMASGIAHEINNPLTGVVGFSELLMTKDLPEDLRKDVEVIYTGSKRVAGIVKGLLTFARQHKPERTYTDINEVIESTLTLKKYALETGNIEVSTSLDAELPWIMADAGQLQQVFMNIVINAETEMKQARGRGKLIIKTEQIDNTIRISFKDDGPGITKENIGKVFDPFFTTREVGEGTGLGLSLSHGIISEHKGALYVKSRLGKGATFFIELPIIAEERQLGLAEPSDELKGVSGARILVMDDEPTILIFLKKILGGEGYDVETVGSGKEALGMIKNKRYGLILCDIKLPGLSGAEIYEQIGKVAPSLQKRVIFITGDVISADTQAFLKKTKAPYVTKPFDIAKLKKEVSRILSGNS